MNKFDLFLESCKAEKWRYRQWMCSIFNVTRLPENFVPGPFDLQYKEDGVYYYDDKLKSWVQIEDAKANEPLYDMNWAMDFPAGHFPNHPEPIRTTYGRALYNWMCIIYPFGDKVEFINKPADARTAVPLFAPITVDDDVEIGDQKLVHAKAIEDHLSALSQTTALAPLITPTGTERTLVASPEVIKYIKDSLKALNNKPTRQQLVEIQNHAVMLDKKYLAEDGESLDFYISGTTLKVRRFKQLYMFGAVDAFHDDGKYDLITQSLDEGIPIADLPALFNDARQGSFDRGADTAKGGYGASNYMQITQNLAVDMTTDCRTKVTQTIMLDEDWYKVYGSEAGYYKIVNGKPVPITKADIGKVIQMRRPLLCGHAKTGTICHICMGTTMAKSEKAIKSGITQMQHFIMYGFMSAMHGNEQVTARYNFKKHIR